MWKKAISIAMLGIATAIPVVAGGCASNQEQPNAVTGQPGMDPAAFDQYRNYHAEWEGKPWLNPRFQDQKHHYHPEWVGATGH
jgi:hypothetical protein